MTVAYAFANKEAGPYLEGIRHAVQSPCDMSSVSLDKLGDYGPYLSALARKARDAGIRTTVEIRGTPGASAAREGQLFLNQFYQSPAYRDSEPFTGGVVDEATDDIGTFYSRTSRN